MAYLRPQSATKQQRLLSLAEGVLMKSAEIELGAGACAIAFSLLLTHTSALAQGAPGAAPEEGVLENIVVTAQRREENLIDVPIAVSAFDNAGLERRQIEQATD